MSEWLHKVTNPNDNKARTRSLVSYLCNQSSFQYLVLLMSVEYLYLRVLLQPETDLALNQHITFIHINTHSQLVILKIALLLGSWEPSLSFALSVSKSYPFLLCLVSQLENLPGIHACFSFPPFQGSTLLSWTKQTLCFNSISNILYLSLFNLTGPYIQLQESSSMSNFWFLFSEAFNGSHLPLESHEKSYSNDYLHT